ncbi:MAG: TetR/AcrR family transcriptional regulator [Microscillaceae bacterium]
MNTGIREKEEVKEKILDQAREHFRRYGIRSVSMDDIAKELGMSKKTIYQHFKDKDDLVCQFIARQMEMEYQDLKALAENAQDAIDAVLKMSGYFKELYSNVNPALIYDLEKYHPNARQVEKHYEETFFRQMMVENLRKGMADGFYRAEIDPEFVSIMWMRMMEWVCDPDAFPPQQYDIWDTHLRLVEMIIRGIVTLRGFQILEEHQHHFQTQNP